jgi:hypothetical protein
MLNELEGYTNRIKQTSITLNNETTIHNNILDQVGKDYLKTSSSLKNEIKYALNTRKTQGGVCQLYIIIIVEFLLLFTLLYFGLS